MYNGSGVGSCDDIVSSKLQKCWHKRHLDEQGHWGNHGRICDGGSVLHEVWSDLRMRRLERTIHLNHKRTTRDQREGQLSYEGETPRKWSRLVCKLRRISLKDPKYRTKYENTQMVVSGWGIMNTNSDKECVIRTGKYSVEFDSWCGHQEHRGGKRWLISRETRTNCSISWNCQSDG